MESLESLRMRLDPQEQIEQPVRRCGECRHPVYSGEDYFEEYGEVYCLHCWSEKQEKETKECRRTA